jgi:hypothetical protein
MAGTKNFGDFKEIISPFLRNKINSLKSIYGESSKEYNSIASQYFKSDLEVLITKDQRLRHYQSEVNIYFENKPLIGVERLYKKTILINMNKKSMKCKHIMKSKSQSLRENMKNKLFQKIIFRLKNIWL